MDETHAYDVRSIKQYLSDAQSGKVTIYMSSISAVEILPSKLKKSNSFEDFMDDYQGVIVLSDPGPNVMTLAGRLRDLPYKKGNSEKRRLSTPDAIILATAVHLQEALNVKLDCFHTFDRGKQKSSDGKKAIPIIGYEQWCEGFDVDQRALSEKVTGMNRCEPTHPEPTMDLVQAVADTI